ncbi:hypothetical protein [Sphingomonas sp. Leaf10]|uniref:hypothetical protein n=1 Tax=Sphingomonas sp. Leaf10 TaxID=1735676 RepID=UPI0006F7A3F9|nr:hypothetical protein [Sphingomonas sp. Leaf10]KQM41406.1 hypothetical protein ASE59_03850 [Sphingomonas sp. Leaf10]
MKRVSLILLTGLAGSGCSQPATTKTQAETIEAIAVRCDLPKGTMTLTGPDELRFQPPADAKYESVDCALGELKKLKFPMKMGFVGNEAIAPETK